MAEFYTYRFGATDIPAKVAGGTGLSPLIVAALSVIETSFVFPSVLDENQKASLDEFMSNRGYSFWRQTQGEAIFHANASITNNAKTITGNTWQTLGGAVTNASFFAGHFAKLFGQVVGSVNTTDALGELRVVETDDAGVEVVLGAWALANTNGAWKMQRLATTVLPRVGDMTYRLEGKTAGADFQMRFTSLVLLENV